jgi:hypothetical protein
MSDAHRFEGGCHCGNLAYVFEASAGLDVIGLRADQCSFCRAHRNRTTSDPKGIMRIFVREPSALSRYRFGLGITDFLICARCGVFIGALMEEGDKAWFTVNANTFYSPPPDDFPIAPVDYDAEDTAARIARRKQKWTPVIEFAEALR